MLKKLNSDYLGLISSALCLIHCLALPFIVVFFGEALHSIEHLEFLDWIFAIISLYAAYDSIKRTNSNYLKLSFVLGWILFIIGIVMHEDPIFSYTLHLGSIVLISSHLVNYKLYKKNSCEIKYEK